MYITFMYSLSGGKTSYSSRNIILSVQLQIKQNIFGILVDFICHVNKRLGNWNQLI